MQLGQNAQVLSELWPGWSGSTLLRASVQLQGRLIWLRGTLVSCCCAMMALIG